MTCDYLIVGAGLAGSMLGYLLQKNGYNVIILEKQSLSSKHKLCGGIVTPKAYSLLMTHFNQKDVQATVKTTFTTCKVTDKVEVGLKDIDIKIVDRKLLDDYILNEYIKLGGKIIENCKAESIDFNRNILTANGETYTFKHLIGADGVLSQVRKYLTGKIQNKNFALESFQQTDNKLDFKIEFVKDYKGYNWVIPANNVVCIGTGNIAGDTEIQDVYDELTNKYSLSSEKKGAFLPTGNDIMLNKGNVYFIGDAAGLISPVTGEGIYYALYSACMLFECFSKGKSYSKCMQRVVKDIKLQLKLVKVIYSDKIRNFVFTIMKRDNGISKLIIKHVKKILLN